MQFRLKKREINICINSKVDISLHYHKTIGRNYANNTD
jgi:hypothetical protein